MQCAELKREQDKWVYNERVAKSPLKKKRNKEKLGEITQQEKDVYEERKIKR